MTRLLSDQSKAAIDDPGWVLEKYREAKELIDELYHDDVVMRAVNGEMRDDIEAFWASTFMDTCTTFGSDCGCNREVDAHGKSLRPYPAAFTNDDPKEGS